MRDNALIVGHLAPSFVLHDGASHATPSPRNGTWLLVFARRWAPSREPEMGAIRAQLRGLVARMLVVTDEGVWWYEPGLEGERFMPRSPRLDDDLTLLATRYGVDTGTDAAFLVDESGVIRFAQTPPMRLALNVPLALGAATAAVMQPRRQATRAIVRALERSAAA